MPAIQHSEIIAIEKPHPGQKIILDSSKRFKVLACGRRFGKTVIAKRRLILQGYQNARYIGYYCPTYKMLAETWREVSHTLARVTLRKDEHLKQLLTTSGGVIDFWSLENHNAGRGRKYHEVIIDEAAYVDDLSDIWNKVLRPTLTDLRGRALFLSTPNGFDNDFKTFFDFQEKYPDLWESFQMPTSVNPRIPKDELALAKMELPKDAYAQEYEAQFVIFAGKLFADQFDFTKHISTQAEYQPEYDIYLSWDFNITLSVVVFQHGDNFIHALREYHEPGWDLERLCNEIRLDFPYAFFHINGDASGSARSSLTKGNATAYDLIKNYLNLEWEQFNIPSVNPSHLNSRLECNFILKNDNFFIHPTCKRLITDLSSVKIDDRQSIDVWKKKNPDKGHIFDCWRYFIHAEHRQKLNFYRFNEAAVA